MTLGFSPSFTVKCICFSYLISIQSKILTRVELVNLPANTSEFDMRKFSNDFSWDIMKAILLPGKKKKKKKKKETVFILQC